MEKKRTFTKTKGTPTMVDQHVGDRLRKRRTLLGWSQEKLANAVDITFQQVQKYERGQNRVSASRLFQFSQILDVPVAYFFDGYTTKDMSVADLTGFSDNQQDSYQNSDIFDRKETMELIRTYYSIQDPKVRKSLFKLIKSMADKE